jgi:hypothetical protein
MLFVIAQLVACLPMVWVMGLISNEVLFQYHVCIGFGGHNISFTF